MELFQLNKLVRSVLESSLDEEYWVEGELSDANEGAGGHFYGELVQKEQDGQRIIARARITCWARTYGMLRLRFHSETGETLHSGMKVKLLVRISFHEQYGYALNVQDVDATFTLGDLAKRRREILAQLEEDGILHDNQDLPMPRLIRRIAVVSSETAAGYGDFCNQLHSNIYGFKFCVQLFPALMQGQHVPESIISALQQIQEQDFDVVVIIRGGGATSDLSDFDSYPLAACVAQYPIPVITGIGHERDQTVLDYVAHTRVKTPTAAAAFILEHQLDEASLLDRLEDSILQGSQHRIERERQRLERLAVVLPLAFTRMKERVEHMLELKFQRISSIALQRIVSERNRLTLLSQRVKMSDPTRLLRLGYSITTCNGEVVRDASKLKSGDEINTKFEKGTVKAIVK